MLDNIRKKLDEIEVQEHVKILHCIESGSRAWGFASPDSDYDVRFVYVRRREDYLRLDDVYDINGWDLQKYLRLLYKSNPTAFEWNASPVVYRTTLEWEQIAVVTGDYFQKKHILHHYLSMAKNNHRAYLQEESVSLKKYFYVLRPVLACRWILDRETFPPIEFDKLVKAELPADLSGTVEHLLEIKRNTPEIGKGAHIAELDGFFREEFAAIENAASAVTGSPDRSWEPLNDIFLQMLDIS